MIMIPILTLPATRICISISMFSLHTYIHIHAHMHIRIRSAYRYAYSARCASLANCYRLFQFTLWPQDGRIRRLLFGGD